MEGKIRFIFLNIFCFSKISFLGSHQLIIFTNLVVNEMQDSIVKINDIQFINITGTSVSKVAVDIACSKHHPCQNVHLSNINLKYSGNDNDQAPFSSSCVNAHVGYHGLQLPPPCR